jgi:hypothetical protein
VLSTVELTEKEAIAALADIKSQISALVAEGEELATKYDLSFSLDIAYGMGGYYDTDDQEWCSSSQNC